MPTDYVGNYGAALRRLTALDAQSGAFAPQKLGGGDTGGFGPSLTVGPSKPQQPQLGGALSAPEQAPQAAAPPVAPLSGGASGGGALDPAQAPSVPQPPVAIDESGALGGSSPVATPDSGEPPKGWKDLTADMPDEEKDRLVESISKSGNMDEMLAKAQAVPGSLKDKWQKTDKRQLAMYLAEIAIRTLSKRNQPQYRTSSASAFADAVLETDAIMAQQAETRRLEGRADTEKRRQETRTDTETKRKEGREDAQDKTKRDRELEDDERNHKQALELERVKAKLDRETGKKHSIIYGDDNVPRLVDDEGNAVQVTEEVTETTPKKGSRGKGTTGGKTTTTRKPVKVKPKTDSSSLDQDTVIRAIEARVKELKDDGKLIRDLRKKGITGLDAERQIREEAEKQVRESIGNSGTGSEKILDFNEMN